MSFQLTESSLSLRSPPELEHQRVNADKNKQKNPRCPGHTDTKSVSLLWCSSMVVLENLFIEFLHSSLSCGPSLKFGRVQKSAQSFFQLSRPCVSSLLHLTGLLKYLPAAGDQTLALNIVLYLHYTEGQIVTANVVTITSNNELKVIKDVS